MASKESLLKDFPNDWIHWIEVELACERKVAKGTWYNAPCCTTCYARVEG